MPSQSKRTPLRGWLREFFMRGCAATFGYFKFTARRGVHGKVTRSRPKGGTTFGVGSFERAEKLSGQDWTARRQLACLQQAGAFQERLPPFEAQGKQKAAATWRRAQPLRDSGQAGMAVPRRKERKGKEGKKGKKERKERATT